MNDHKDTAPIACPSARDLAAVLADDEIFDDWDVSPVGYAGLAPGPTVASFEADDSEWVYEITVRRVRRA